MTTTVIDAPTTTAPAQPIRTPAFGRTRRGIVRLQAAHATRQVLHELIAQPEPKHGRRPAFVRVDELTERYAALGGEPADLLGRRRTFAIGGAFRTAGRAVQARHDEWLRRELDRAATTRAHQYETGGDFGVQP